MCGDILCFSVLYDILAAQNLLSNQSFMEHQLIDTVLRVFGTISCAYWWHVLFGKCLSLRCFQVSTMRPAILPDSPWMHIGHKNKFFEQISEKWQPAYQMFVFSNCKNHAIYHLPFWPKKKNSNSQLVGTIAFKAPILRLVHANAIFNPYNTFLYSFDYRGEHTRFGYGNDVSHYPFDGGVHHSNDNIYLFPSPPDVANLNEADTQMAKKMVHIWTSFITNGFPELNSTLDWLPAISTKRY